jgi:tRNA-dihydrouridine synthase 3
LQPSLFLFSSTQVRTASQGDEINVRRVVSELRQAGAAAVTVHGRTAEQRYSKAADWSLIQAVVGDGIAAGSVVPVIGNGDVQEWYEARRRMEETGEARHTASASANWLSGLALQPPPPPPSTEAHLPLSM